MKRIALIIMLAGLLPAQRPQECYTCLVQQCQAVQGQIDDLETQILWAEGIAAAMAAVCKYSPWPYFEAVGCGSAAGVAAMIPYMKYQVQYLKVQMARMGCFPGMSG